MEHLLHVLLDPEFQADPSDQALPVEDKRKYMFENITKTLNVKSFFFWK